jgi:hypothetical protein
MEPGVLALVKGSDNFPEMIGRCVTLASKAYQHKCLDMDAPDWAVKIEPHRLEVDGGTIVVKTGWCKNLMRLEDPDCMDGVEDPYQVNRPITEVVQVSIELQPTVT